MIRKLLRFRLKKPKVLVVLAALLISLIAIPAFSGSPLMASQDATIQFVSPDWLAKNSSDRCSNFNFGFVCIACLHTAF